MYLADEHARRDDSVVFMSTDSGKRVITENLVLDFLRASLRSHDKAKNILMSFEYAMLHPWTINLENGPYSGTFVDCAKQAERYELRIFLAVLICWKREKLPENAATGGLVATIEKLSRNTPEFFTALSGVLDAFQLTQSKAQLQTHITAAQESKHNEKHQSPFMF